MSDPDEKGEPLSHLAEIYNPGYYFWKAVQNVFHPFPTNELDRYDNIFLQPQEPRENLAVVDGRTDIALHSRFFLAIELDRCLVDGFDQQELTSPAPSLL